MLDVLYWQQFSTACHRGASLKSIIDAPFSMNMIVQYAAQCSCAPLSLVSALLARQRGIKCKQAVVVTI
jgi:hypothetical protein